MGMFKRKSAQQHSAVSPLPAPPSSSRASVSSLASTQQYHDNRAQPYPQGAPAERVHSRQSRMSIGTMDSQHTVTEGGRRKSGGFLGFGRKKDKIKVDEEDEQQQSQPGSARQSFTVAGRPSGGALPEQRGLQRPMSQQPGSFVHQNGRVVPANQQQQQLQQQQQQPQQRSDFGPAPPGQHARGQSLGANQGLGVVPPMARAASGDASRGTPPESPALGGGLADVAATGVDGKNPQFREAFEPVVELITYQPHKTYVASPPQLEMIFARTSAGQQPRQGAPGSPTNDWDAVWLQLSGTSLSMWSMKETRAAAAAGTKVPPTYFNITESTLELLSPLPPPPHRPNSHPHTYVFSLNTAGSNRLLFSCPTEKDLVRWTTGLRLAAWERSRLEEIYTGHLIQAGRREPRSPLMGGRFEGWVRVRVMGGIEWHRLWLVLSDPETLTPESNMGTQGKRRSSFFGLGHEKHETIQEPNTGVPMASFYNEPRTAKNRTSSLPVLTVTNVTQAYAMFPERLEVISQSNLMKVVGRVSGDLVTIEGGLRESGWAMIMPEAPTEEPSAPAVSPLAVMMRWVTAFHDAFKLYGRPQQYSWNENDPRSLFFGYPRGEFRGDLFLTMDEAMRSNHRLNTPAIRAQYIGIMQRGLGQRPRVDQVNEGPIEEEEDPKMRQEREYIQQAQKESVAALQAQEQQKQQHQQQNGHDSSFTLPPLQFSEENEQDSGGSGASAAAAGAAAAGALAAGGVTAAMYNDDPRSLTPITESEASRQNSSRRPPGGDLSQAANAAGPPPAVRQMSTGSNTPHAFQPDVAPGQQSSRAPVQTSGPTGRPMSMATFGNREAGDAIASPVTAVASVTSPGGTTTSPSASRNASTRQGTLASEESQPTVWSQSSGVTPTNATPTMPTAPLQDSNAPTPPPANGMANGSFAAATSSGQHRGSPPPPQAAKAGSAPPFPSGAGPAASQFAAQKAPQGAQAYATTTQTPPAQFATQPASPPFAAAGTASQSSHSKSAHSSSTMPVAAVGAGLAAGAAAIGAAAFASHQNQSQNQSPPRNSPPSDGTLHQPKPRASQRISMTDVSGLREEPAAMYLMNMVEDGPAPPSTLQPAPTAKAALPAQSALGSSPPLKAAPEPVVAAPAPPPKVTPTSPVRSVAGPSSPGRAGQSTVRAASHTSPPPNVGGVPATSMLLGSPPQSQGHSGLPSPPQSQAHSSLLASPPSSGGLAGAAAYRPRSPQHQQVSPVRDESRSPASVGSDKPTRPTITTSLDQQHSRSGMVRKPSGARAQHPHNPQQHQSQLGAVRTRSHEGESQAGVPVIQENVEAGRATNNATGPGTAADPSIEGRVMTSPQDVNSNTSPSHISSNSTTAAGKMHDFAPDTAAYLAYADRDQPESAANHSRSKLPSPPQQVQEARSSFAPSKAAADRRAKAEASSSDQQRSMALPGAGRQKTAQKPDNYDSDTDESEDDEEDGPVHAPERRGSRALPSLPGQPGQSNQQTPTIQQPPYQQQQQQQQAPYNPQQQFYGGGHPQQQQQHYGGRHGSPINGDRDRYEPPSMSSLSINDPRYDRPRSRSPTHRHLPPQPHQQAPPQERERPREAQRVAPLPAPPAAKENVWNANFAVEHGMDRKGTFVELEEPQVALTKAFTPGGLIQAGMQDKQDRSAKRQEEVARETGSALINVPEPPPPPQTGLVGAVAAHERDRKNAGGIGATLTDRDRERRLAEERQRKIDELQRQQMEHMQQQYTGGGMYGGQFPGQFGGYGMPPMGGYPYGGGMMNPAMQQQAMMAAQMAYQQTMMAMSAAGSQAGDANDGRGSPTASMRMSPPPFNPMGQMGGMPGMPGYGGFGMPPQSMYGGYGGYGMPGMGGPGSAWGASPTGNFHGLAPGNGHGGSGGGSYPTSERGEERQAS